MDEIVSKIRAVLISNKGKSDLREMQKDYKMLMGEDIPYKKLGYTNLEAFVKNAPTLKITQGPNGALFVEAAVTSSSKHMVQLITKQKSSSKKKSGGSGRLPARYQSSRSGYNGGRFQQSPSTRSRNNQQWRAQYLNSARPKSHVHQIVVNNNNINSSTSSIQQRLVKSTTQNPVTNITNINDVPTRKPPAKITTSLSSPQFNTPSGAPQVPVVVKNDSRPRMRTQQSFTPQTQTQTQIQGSQLGSSMHSGPRHVAPTLSAAAIQSLLDKDNKQINTMINRNLKITITNNPPNMNTNTTNTNTNRNVNSIINNKELKPLEKLEQFTRMNGLSEPVLKTMQLPKAGHPFICTIKIDNESFTSYPVDCPTLLAAETEAVNNAFEMLLKRYSENEQSLLISTENDVLTRIPPIIECHYSGVWAEQIALDYRDKYREQLPPNWLALLDTLPTISVEPAIDQRYVLKICKHGEKNIKSNLNTSQLSSDVSVPSSKLILEPEGWMVEVTYAASTIEVWCRLVDTPDANKYCDMANKLQAYYNTSVSGNERATNVAPGGFYVVRFDEYWCRVRVLNTNEHDVTCFFIDYGEEHNVPKSDMYILQREFAKEQAQAFVCSLSGLEELANMGAASNCLDQLTEQVYLAKPQMNEGPNDLEPPAISITLYDKHSEDINLRLIQEITTESVPKLNPKNINHVYVTHVTDTGDIYVQCHSDAFNKVNELIEALESENLEEYSCQTLPPERDATAMYLARWTTSQGGDDHLYRAKIGDRSPCGTFICLYFIDFGNIQIIQKEDMSPIYNLNKISDVLCAFPPLTTRVRLDLEAVTTSDKHFAERVMELLPTNKPVLLKIVDTIEDQEKNKIPICEIFRRSETHNELFSVNASLKYIDTSPETEDTNNNDKAIQSLKKLERLKSISERIIDNSNNKPVPSTGILSSPNVPEPGNYFDVRIPFAVNPWNFFVQPYDTAGQLQDLMKNMQLRYGATPTTMLEQLQLEDVIPGRIYASKYNDGKWYRTSVIKVINSGSISVFYCDFGYYANLTVKQLVALDVQFVELPYQAIKARLAGIQPRDTKWSMDDCKYFEQLVHERTFVSIIDAVQRDELYQCDSVLILRLIDTSTDKDIHIDKLLIQKDIAIAAAM